MAEKGRPEQGVYDSTSSYGPVLGDTRCGLGGADQRVLMAWFNGAGYMPEDSVHGCRRE